MDAEHKQSSSFLVRCWVEPREVSDEPEIMRVYVRNLQTGEEQYVNSPSQLGELLQRELHQQAAGRQAVEPGMLSRSEAG